MKFAVVVFPGSNCDHDAYHAVKHVLGQPAEFLWHKDTSLQGADVVILPGGFSYGDYLRTGAIARFSPVMQAVSAFAAQGGPVLGICNGFQILCEAGLLDGVLIRNKQVQFRCEYVHVRVEETDTPFTSAASRGQVLHVPIAHGEGQYFAEPDVLQRLEANRQVIFRYATAAGEITDAANCNGSLNNIAGICNASRNVVGLMPHPERACEKALGSDDGLREDEYARILGILGREPNMTELGMFSVMWSEHCSYKSSRIHLKTLPTQGPRVLQGPGENAGAVDIGDGLAAVFKIESHNHPSFIEPYQGAATGVGGIIRDIFTMGARPIALLDSLRFGDLGEPGTRRIVTGVVAGIAGYGNSIGIPTVGGEAFFDPSYAGNPLVNVFCLGTVAADGIVKGKAEGVGNAVYYVGASTGRDGIHGATMASAEFDDASAEKRPAVQVGDPFMEKLLLEACLEVLKTGALVGLQDMGAAGLTCATSEMSARGHMGMDVEVTKVPQRETGMSPYEIMLSESQERMLFVVHKGREADVERIFEKWDLHAVCIGHVTDDGLVRVRENGVVVAEVPARALADEAPLYDRPTQRPAWLDDIQRLAPEHFKAFPKTDEVLTTLLASPTVASKKWIYRQYDHMVRTNTLCLAGRGTPVVRVKGTDRALAMSVDGNGRYGQTDPKRGAMLAVAEAARNVALAGGVPIGATNNLNFGNPEKPEIMWQFVEAVRGIGEACRAFGVPITGGNVSLYNETDGKAIYPTPVLGIVGLIEDASRVVGQNFPSEGLKIVMLGETRAELGATEYLQRVHGQVRGLPPALDLAHERALHGLLPELVQSGLVASAHDCAEGGLAVALAECTFGDTPVGATVDVVGVTGPAGVPVEHATLFSESAGRVLLAVTPGHVAEVLDKAGAAGVVANVIGTTGGETLTIRVDGEPALTAAVGELQAVWANALEDALATR